MTYSGNMYSNLMWGNDKVNNMDSKKLGALQQVIKITIHCRTNLEIGEKTNLQDKLTEGRVIFFFAVNGCIFCLFVLFLFLNWLYFFNYQFLKI